MIFDADTIFEKLTIPGRVGNFSKICSRVKKPNFAQNGVLQEPHTSKPLWQDGADVVICFTVRPSAKKSKLVREHDNSIRVDIHATAERGKANDELLSFVSSIFHKPRADITLRHGHTSRKKIVSISHMSVAEAQNILSSLLVE